MKLEKLSKEIRISKSELLTIKGGTSTTLYTTIGKLPNLKGCENEHEDSNGSGKLDDGDGAAIPMGC